MNTQNKYHLLGLGFIGVSITGLLLYQYNKKHKKDNQNKLKQSVVAQYSQFVKYYKENQNQVCCGEGQSCARDKSLPWELMKQDYGNSEGYQKQADIGQGCGVPTKFAIIQKGQTVVDLGSGAGIDAFMARKQVGDKGLVIGIDMSDQMLKKSQMIADNSGFNNVHFRKGDCENTNLKGNFADIVLSNCVINMIPDKVNVYKQIFRILKSGGSFCISDIVSDKELSPQFSKSLKLRVACIGGARPIVVIEQMVRLVGFVDFKIVSLKQLKNLGQVIKKNLSNQQYQKFVKQGTKIISCTMQAKKP